MINYSLNALYRELGVSKQAVHQSLQRQKAFDNELSSLVLFADKLRENHPGCGVEKMYDTLLPATMGRDKFCDIFQSLGYGLKQIKNRTRTTIAGSLKYPNLIENMQVTGPNQVIQSDITYFDFHGKFYYLVFIIDVYSKEIVGYNVCDHLFAKANVRAMKMALNKMDLTNTTLIHHSDQGCQYTSLEYRKLLLKHGIQISMGSIATDNAFAERVNGTIKNEYLKLWDITTEKSLKIKTKKAVDNYNKYRKHNWFNNKYSPFEFKENLVNLNAQDRPKVIIYTEGNKKGKGVSNALTFCTGKEPQAPNCPMELIDS